MRNAKNAPYGFADASDGKIPNPTAETPPQARKTRNSGIRDALDRTLDDSIHVVIGDINRLCEERWAMPEREYKAKLYFFEGRKLTLIEIRHIIQERLRR